jgi:hypothetical protein
MYSPTAYEDHTEKEKEELDRLIQKLILDKAEPIYRSFWEKGDRETLNELKKHIKHLF